LLKAAQRLEKIGRISEEAEPSIVSIEPIAILGAAAEFNSQASF
jgi:hypothetical protein